MAYGPTRAGRGKWRCHYCGIRPGTTTDHIVPKALGGPDVSWNYVPACVQCNSEKGSKWPTHDCDKCQEAIRRFQENPDLNHRAIQSLRTRKENYLEGIEANVRKINHLTELIDDIDSELARFEAGARE